VPRSKSSPLKRGRPESRTARARKAGFRPLSVVCMLVVLSAVAICLTAWAVRAYCSALRDDMGISNAPPPAVGSGRLTLPSRLPGGQPIQNLQRPIPYDCRHGLRANVTPSQEVTSCQWLDHLPSAENRMGGGPARPIPACWTFPTRLAAASVEPEWWRGRPALASRSPLGLAQPACDPSWS
jgi:hypothetical protein